jgi:nucleoside-diphosphate-sugar epimerase
LIIGCGYLGVPLGQRLLRAGYEVCGMRRANEGDGELIGQGIRPLHADITKPAELAQIEANFGVVVNTVSSSRGSLEDYTAVYLGGTKNIFEWFASGSAPRIYIHTSSTSVYGQTDGSWVTEDSPAEGASPTSRVLVEAEKEALRASVAGFSAIVVRLSGIYGPGRGHLFRQYLRNEATLRGTGESWINMIHVQDAAAAISHLVSAVDPERLEKIYNLSDDEPVTHLDFFQWLSSELGKPLPPSAPVDPNRKRGVTNKRVSNARLKETGFQFQYPNYRAGYAGEIEAAKK